MRSFFSAWTVADKIEQARKKLSAAVVTGLLALVGGTRAADCDGSGVDDRLELEDGSLADCDGNGVPDDCDVTPGLRLRAPRSFLAGEGARWLSAVDLDGDGDLDVAVSNRLAGSITLVENHGAGDFTARAFEVDGRPEGIAAGDFDGDGRGDLAIADGVASRVVLLRGRPDGFEPAGTLPAGDRPGALVSADLDGDGDLDLAAASRGSDEVRVWTNRDGRFAAASRHGTGRFPVYLAAADLDGDGDVDLVAVNGRARELTWLDNRGEGVFTARAIDSGGAWPASVAPGDLDGDGDLDLAVVHPARRKVTLLLQTTPGDFTRGEEVALVQEPRHGAVADLDGDGDLDLAVVSAGSGRGELTLFWNDGRGSFPRHEVLAAGSSPAFVLPHDADPGGDVDLWVADELAGRIVRFENRGDGRPRAPSSFPLGVEPSLVLAVDLDGDGRPELAVADRHRESLFLLETDGASGLRVVEERAVLDGSALRDLERADMEGDGDQDIVVLTARVDFPPVIRRGLDGFTVLRNAGDGTLASSGVQDVPGEPRSVAVADFDEDGLLDVVVATGGVGGTVAQYLAEGDAFRFAGRLLPASNYEALVAADLDGDGHQDLVVSRSAGETLQFLPGDGLGFSRRVALSVPAAGDGIVAIVASDLDGDGVPDLATANFASSSLSIVRGRGVGAFRVAEFDEPLSIDLGAPPTDLVAADLDADGSPELVASMPSAGGVVVLRLGGAGFRRPREYSVGDRPAAIAVGDLDGDGDGDVVTVSGASGRLSIIWNETVAAARADRDGDGVPDVCDGRRDPRLRRGDAGGDGDVDLGDAALLLEFLFRGGREPPCRKAADADDDGRLTVSDVVAVLLHLFGGGELPRPFAACGPDPTADGLDCRTGCP